ncbi:MAG: hypothetical protein NTY19_37210, partial [Planctomycetota bacterium]|nr:hypothetical protein [Planctomycetota bacterium]
MKRSTNCLDLACGLAALLPLAVAVGQEDSFRRSADTRVSELAHYLEQVEIYAPSVYHHLAIFP